MGLVGGKEEISPSRTRVPLWTQAGTQECPRTLSYTLDIVRSPLSESGSNKTDKSGADKKISSITKF